MQQLNKNRSNPAYLCGQLLAILEEAQQRATFAKSKKRLDTTIVNRFYGGASSAPAATFGGLIRLATTAHLREVGKEVNEALERAMAQLDDVGGFPKTLALAQQAEFALGFYHQRADFRASRGDRKGATAKQEEYNNDDRD